jgi:hypothetical protein
MLTTSTLRDFDRPNLSLPDAADLLRRADVPGRVDTAMDTAAEVARAVIEQLPGQRKRRRPPVLLAGIVVGALAVTGVTAWWMRRSAARLEARRLAEEERELDLAALDRAADEGMTGPAVTPAGISVAGTTGLGSTAPHRDGSALAEPVF